MRQITRTAAPIILAGLLILGLVAVVDAQARDVVGTLIARVLTVQNSATFNGPAAFTAGITADAVSTTDSALLPGTAISVTTGATITPLAAYQPLTGAPSTVITPSLVLTGTAGDLLVLVNSGTASLIMLDAGNLALSSVYTMTANDSLTLISDGASWIELARSAN